MSNIDESILLKNDEFSDRMEEGILMPPEQIPIGEVASYTKVMDRIAVRQGLAPHKIAKNFKMVSEQFGIHLTDDFVKIPEYEQLKLPMQVV